MRIPFFPFSYARRNNLPTPGSENLAFLDLILNEYTAIGAGTANRRQLQNFQPVTYVPHIVGVSGLGGLQNGQIYGQPLIVRNGS